jgi:hypothetical protein
LLPTTDGLILDTSGLPETAQKQLVLKLTAYKVSIGSGSHQGVQRTRHEYRFPGAAGGTRNEKVELNIRLIVDLHLPNSRRDHNNQSN